MGNGNITKERTAKPSTGYKRIRVLLYEEIKPGRIITVNDILNKPNIRNEGGAAYIVREQQW